MAVEMETNLQVYLRIRPPSLDGHGEAKVCLELENPGVVRLVRQSSERDVRRVREQETFSGFTGIFPSNATQEEVFNGAMAPVIECVKQGKSALLVAMGPTGAGKSHTIVGSFSDQGLLPRTLKYFFSWEWQGTAGSPRFGSEEEGKMGLRISMVEIYSENGGRSEKLLDLLNGTELSFSNWKKKGMHEELVSTAEEALAIANIGIQKRSTACTGANDQSSRSHCIVTLRVAKGVSLIIADLAGSEREKQTGNQGVRLTESSFINNTAMVFGQCLRALLEHQKNPKRPLEKYFHNSLLTKYLKDYMEAKGWMSLIVNVSPREEDYYNTSFVLKQAAPFSEIRTFPNAPSEKKRPPSTPTRPWKRRCVPPPPHLSGRLVTEEFARQLTPRGTQEATYLAKLSSEDGLNEFKLFSKWEMDKALSSQREEHNKEISLAVAEALAEMSTQMNQQHENEIAELATKHAGVVVELCRQYEASIQLLQRLHRVSAEALKSQLQHDLKPGVAEVLGSTSPLVKDEGNPLGDCRSIPEIRPGDLEPRRTNDTYADGVEGETAGVSEDAVELAGTDIDANEENGKGVAAVSPLAPAPPSTLRKSCAFSEVQCEGIAEVLSASAVVMSSVSKSSVASDGGAVVQDTWLEDGTFGTYQKSGVASDGGADVQEAWLEDLESPKAAGESLIMIGSIRETDLETFLNRDAENDGTSRDMFKGAESIDEATAESNGEAAIGIAVVGDVEVAQTGTTSDTTLEPAVQVVHRILAAEMPVEEGSQVVKTSSEAVRGLDERHEVVKTENAMTTVRDENVVEAGYTEREGQVQATYLATQKLETADVPSVLDVKGPSKHQQEAEVATLRTPNHLPSLSDLKSSKLWQAEVPHLPEQPEVAPKRGTGKKMGTQRVKAEAHVAVADIDPNLRRESAEYDLLRTADSASTHGSLVHVNRSALSRKTDELKTESGLQKGRTIANALATKRELPASEKPLGPIGRLLEEVLGVTVREIEAGLWYGVEEDAAKMAMLLEKHGGVLDVGGFKFSAQKTICLRCLFAYICNQGHVNKQWVHLSDGIQGRSELFGQIVRSRTVADAAVIAKKGLEHEGLLKVVGKGKADSLDEGDGYTTPVPRVRDSSRTTAGSGVDNLRQKMLTTVQMKEHTEVWKVTECSATSVKRVSNNLRRAVLDERLSGEETSKPLWRSIFGVSSPSARRHVVELSSGDETTPQKSSGMRRAVAARFRDDSARKKTSVPLNETSVQVWKTSVHSGEKENSVSSKISPTAIPKRKWKLPPLSARNQKSSFQESKVCVGEGEITNNLWRGSKGDPSSICNQLQKALQNADGGREK